MDTNDENGIDLRNREIALLKEVPEVNNKQEYEKIAEALLGEINHLLFGKLSFSKKVHTPDRTKCSGCKAPTTNGKEYEKRICRCLFYQNNESESAKINCRGCAEYDQQYFNLNLTGNFKIVDYEVPPHMDGKDVGEIDILLADDKYYYATEVKPPRSTETLLRMVTEILTYCNGEELNKATKDRLGKKLGDRPLKKAILFFKHKDYTVPEEEREYTEQYKEYFEKDEFYGKYTKRLIDLFGIFVFCADVYKDEGGVKTCRIDLLN